MSKFLVLFFIAISISAHAESDSPSCDPFRHDYQQAIEFVQGTLYRATQGCGDGDSYTFLNCDSATGTRLKGTYVCVHPFRQDEDDYDFEIDRSTMQLETDPQIEISQVHSLGMSRPKLQNLKCEIKQGLGVLMIGNSVTDENEIQSVYAWIGNMQRCNALISEVGRMTGVAWAHQKFELSSEVFQLNLEFEITLTGQAILSEFSSNHPAKNIFRASAPITGSFELVTASPTDGRACICDQL